MCIFHIFLKIWKNVDWSVVSLDIFFTFFVQSGNICMFKNFRKCRQFYEIVEAITEKITKNIGVFFYNFYWISEHSDALFTSSLKISFSICFWSTKIKLKLSLSLHLFWIAIMFRWFLYFKIAFKVAL